MVGGGGASDEENTNISGDGIMQFVLPL